MRQLKRAYRKNTEQRSNFKQKALTAGAAAAITFGVNAGIQKAYADENSAILPDNHQKAVHHDSDSDLLSNSEEFAIGYDPFKQDQNKNGIADGVELAQRAAKVIDALPIYVPGSNMLIPNETYKISHLMRGLEKCDICGEQVNMGYRRVTNATLGLSIEVPEITLHYMEHGSFSYSGDVHGKGRIDVALLKKILEMPQQSGDLGTIFSPADVNQDGIVNTDDLSDFVEIWLNEIKPDRFRYN